MPDDNLKRMIALAEEFFDVKNDPDQISVDEKTRTRLLAIHPNTMTEVRNDGGPIVWILVIPTTTDVMEQFLARQINEQQLLQKTSPDRRYEAVYLCSALVLPEHRGKGMAKRAAVQAVREIQKQHPIKDLFAWTFSADGERLAVSIAKELGLPLRLRETD
jgi:GNAT superfamily N-acetyltransferase